MKLLQKHLRLHNIITWLEEKVGLESDFWGGPGRRQDGARTSLAENEDSKRFQTCSTFFKKLFNVNKQLSVQDMLKMGQKR